MIGGKRLQKAVVTGISNYIALATGSLNNLVEMKLDIANWFSVVSSLKLFRIAHHNLQEDIR